MNVILSPDEFGAKNLIVNKCSMQKSYVYIMTNNSRTLYIGVTADLSKRVSEHKRLFADGFTKRYKITKTYLF